MEEQLPSLPVNTTGVRNSKCHHFLSLGADRVEDLLPSGRIITFKTERWGRKLASEASFIILLKVYYVLLSVLVIWKTGLNEECDSSPEELTDLWRVTVRGLCKQTNAIK